MVAATLRRHKPKAKAPFSQALAAEFGLTKGHVHRVLTGERPSPQYRQLLKRQKQLMREAKNK